MATVKAPSIRKGRPQHFRVEGDSGSVELTRRNKETELANKARFEDGKLKRDADEYRKGGAVRRKGK